MQEVRDEDGGGPGEESRMQLLVLAEQQRGGGDAVNRLEIEREVHRVGAETAQQVDVEAVGEHRANPGEQQQPQPVETVEMGQLGKSRAPLEERQSEQADQTGTGHFPGDHQHRVVARLVHLPTVEHRENGRQQRAEQRHPQPSEMTAFEAGDHHDAKEHQKA